MSKLALITGASHGIGLATAKLFCEAGWDVFNLSRSACPLESVTSISVDLSDEHAIDSLAEILKPKLSQQEKITLIHCAARCDKDNIATIDPEIFNNALDLSLVAPVRLNQLVLPYMQAGSSIIYLGSTLSEQAVPNAASYVTVKHAVAGLMRATCQDLYDTGIHTCCVCPGLTDTEMMRAHLNNDPKIIEAIKDIVCARRLIEPEEIAGFIQYCVDNAIVNGAVLHANLGQRNA